MSEQSCCKCSRRLANNDLYWCIGRQFLCGNCWGSMCIGTWWKALDELKDTEGV